MMRFDVLTLFPDVLEAVLGSSIIGRARDAGLLELYFTDIRDYTKDKHRKVDDTPYSGGGRYAHVAGACICRVYVDRRRSAV